MSQAYDFFVLKETVGSIFFSFEVFLRPLWLLTLNHFNTLQEKAHLSSEAWEHGLNSPQSGSKLL